MWVLQSYNFFCFRYRMRYISGFICFIVSKKECFRETFTKMNTKEGIGDKVDQINDLFFKKVPKLI